MVVGIQPGPYAITPSPASVVSTDTGTALLWRHKFTSLSYVAISCPVALRCAATVSAEAAGRLGAGECIEVQFDNGLQLLCSGGVLQALRQRSYPGRVLGL